MLTTQQSAEPHLSTCLQMS